MNVDILSFGAFFKNTNKKVFKCFNFGKVILQPDIFNSIFDKNNYLEDFLIWNKLIKKELYLKVHRFFMFSVYKKYWNYHEDNIWSILVNKLANSKLCIRKIVYIYNNNDDSLMSNRFNKIDLINLLYRHQMFKKIFNNLDEKKYLIAEAEELISFFGDNEKFFNLIM